jgi:hypothetical protein
LETRVQYTTAIYLSDFLSLGREDKIELLWTGSFFAYDRFEKLTVSQPKSGDDGIVLRIGIFTTLLSLIPATHNYFSSTFGYEFQNNLVLFPNNLIANSGEKQS